MPNVSAHMIVGVEVAKRLNIGSEDFFRGNLLPDIIDCDDSHHKVVSGVYLVPDVTYFLKILDLRDDICKGYLVHLLLDKYYLEDYLSKRFKNKNVFLDEEIYNDYDFLNYKLVRSFNLDVDFFDRVLSNYKQRVSNEKLIYNRECLKQKNSGRFKYLDFESFAQFLINVSELISQELSEYLNNLKSFESKGQVIIKEL